MEAELERDSLTLQLQKLRQEVESLRQAQSQVNPNSILVSLAHINTTVVTPSPSISAPLSLPYPAPPSSLPAIVGANTMFSTCTTLPPPPQTTHEHYDPLNLGFKMQTQDHESMDQAHPFTHDILEASLPRGFKILTHIDAYDGSTDP